MAQLHIYDKFGSLLEQYEIDKPLTEWLRDNVPSYKDQCAPLYSCELNGKPWPYAKHGSNLNDSDVISLTIEPQGVAVYLIAAVVAIGAAAYAYNVASNMPKGYEQSTQDGSSIYSANARANIPRPSGIIREVAGSMQIYPDLIAPPYRYYEDNYEYLSVLLSIGRGYYDLNQNNFYVSETKLLNYINGLYINFYDPSETLSAGDAQIWVTSKEAANVRLTTSASIVAGVWTADFSGDTMTTYFDSGSGPVATAFPFEVDESFDITVGAEAGAYRVVSIAGASNETATLYEQRIDNAYIYIGSGLVSITAAIPQSAKAIRTDVAAASFATATGQTVEFSRASGGAYWYGPYKITDDGVTASKIEIDVSFNQGLVYIDDSGNKNNHSVTIEIQYRDFGTADWTSQQYTFTDNFLGQRVFTRTIDLVSDIEPEVRVRKVTRDSTAIGYYDEVSVTRIKSLISSPPTSYDDITVARIVVRGTDNLSATAENRINIRGATRKLPTLTELENAANGTPFDISRSATTTSGDWNSDYLDFARVTPIGGNTYDGTSGEDDNTAFSWSSDGLYLLAMGKFGVKCMSTSVAFDASALQLIGSNSFQVSEDSKSQCFLTSSGNYFIAKSAKNPSPYGQLLYYTCSTAFNPATATLSGTYTFTNILEDDFSSIYVSSNGEEVYIVCDRGCIHYNMSTAYDVTTMSEVAQFNIGAVTGPASFSDFDGSSLPRKLFAYVSANIRRFDFGTAGDISTLSEVLDSGSLSNIPATPNSMHASQQDFYFAYASDDQNTGLYQYRTRDYIDTRATRSIMRFAAHALYDSLGSRAADLVNWSALSTLETTLDARGDYLDAEFVDETTLWEAIRIMLAPAYAEPVVKDGAFLPVRTITASDYQHIYTPDIMLDDGLSIDSSLYDSEEPDGVEVEYFSLSTYKNEVVLCLASGDAGINPRRIQVIGATDETRAWRLGMRERNRARYKPAQFTFSTEMDALNSEYGDPIAVCSEVFASQCGEVTAYSAPTVTLDFEPDFGAGTYYAAFRKPDGKMSGLYTITAGGSANEITLSSPATLDFTPATDTGEERTLVSIGLSSEWGKRAIVRRIEPQGDNIVQVVAEEYLAEVYQDDDNTPS